MKLMRVFLFLMRLPKVSGIQKIDSDIQFKGKASLEKNRSIRAKNDPREVKRKELEEKYKT